MEEKKRLPCPRCGGTGEEVWQEAHPCAGCGGSGGWWESVWDGDDYREEFVPCGVCGGQGSTLEPILRPCPYCSGQGWVYAREGTPGRMGCLALPMGLLGLALLWRVLG
ncbi:zinc finger domain-containing protein [Meiothermus rufus]|uniref:zinc finger domain-containing protein n=1 Tax=Meiothermus rufus TaxID=604332 RepID=UPI0003FD8214|nr:hypothetical protein [Meiothermus rufus]